MTIRIDPVIRETLRRVAGDITGVGAIIEQLVEERYDVHAKRAIPKKRPMRRWRPKELVPDADYSGTYSEEAYAQRRAFVEPLGSKS